MRRFEIQKGAVGKFWQVSISARTVTTISGPLGTVGHALTAEFPDATSAKAEFEKLIQERLSWGYREVSVPAGAALPAGVEDPADDQPTTHADTAATSYASSSQAGLPGRDVSAPSIPPAAGQSGRDLPAPASPPGMKDLATLPRAQIPAPVEAQSRVPAQTQSAREGASPAASSGVPGHPPAPDRGPAVGARPRGSRTAGVAAAAALLLAGLWLLRPKRSAGSQGSAAAVSQAQRPPPPPPTSAVSAQTAEAEAGPAARPEGSSLSPSTPPSSPDVIAFGFNQTQVSADAVPKLEAVLQQLRREPTAHLRISGFSDAKGSPSARERISRARADSVRAYLVGKGIAPARIAAQASGAASPEESTDQERARDRRVEVLLVP